MSSYEEHKQMLLQKLKQMPEWRQRMFLSKSREFGSVTITENDLKPNKPKLYLIKGK